jgi:hypothetical protein
MIMFNLRKEGEKIEYGFNFYPLSDKSSAGFIFKYLPYRAWRIRYSKNAKRWFVQHIKSSPTPLPDWMQ